MFQHNIEIKQNKIPIQGFDTIIVGSGSAAYNAADWLYDLGRKNIAIVTEGLKMGTSRNTGSDKQTYYKLTLAGEQPDSVYDMAKDLFHGGCVDGDNAYVEAASSAKAFMKLALLGVPFPTNEYGEYVGYQTDHDTRARATSAGPLTSRYMTECLERSVRKKQITILDQMQVFEIVTDGSKAIGVLCIDKEQNKQGNMGLCGIYAKHIIVATGGPAGCYYYSVYPKCHTGMSGMLFEAGVKGANLNYWQYGLASTKFRWNVSGTYQQVLPRYISIDEFGVEREFLEEYYNDPLKAADMVFLKGYQWPFDSEKIEGSSKIDLLVYNETVVHGRKVYMDFRKNPKGVGQDFKGLSNETLEYLKKSDALLPTPIARLEKMNPLAIKLYKDHCIDLYKEPLEVCVCAQHNNGGAEVDKDYQTCIQGVYVVGEAAGIYGPKRPGGSALNSCQVGSMKAAEHIAYSTKEDTTLSKENKELIEQYASKWLERIESSSYSMGKTELLEQREYFAKKMSSCAAHIRNYDEMEQLYQELHAYILESNQRITCNDNSLLSIEIKNRDIFITQLMVLSAMLKEQEKLNSSERMIIEYRNGDCYSYKREVRELVIPDSWFESVWKAYREKVK